MSKPASFEKSVEELEAIVNQLEKGELPLGDALRCFEKGILLARKCEDILRDAEQKVEILTQGTKPRGDGELHD